MFMLLYIDFLSLTCVCVLNEGGHRHAECVEHEREGARAKARARPQVREEAHGGGVGLEYRR